MNLSAIYAHARRRTAPGPPGELLLGSLRDLRRRGMYGVLRDAWERYGDLSCVRFGSKLVYLVVHPDHVQRVLADRRDNYTKQSHRARPLIGDGLPASNGDLWRRQRSLLQPRFQMRFMPQFMGNIGAAIERVAERWERLAARDEPVDVSDEMMLLTLDTIVRSMASEGLAPECAELQEAIRAAVEFVAASGQVFRLPLELPIAANRRFKQALSVIDAFIARAIDAQRNRPAESNLLAFLLGARDDADGGGMSEKLVRDEAVSLLLGGHESTAQALSWIWCMLDVHRDVRARMYNELDAGPVDADAMSKDPVRRPWLDAVVQETLRLYPPFWVLPRHTVADDQLGGYPVPAGTTVMLCPHFTHRHPTFWSDPERFAPERFLEGSAAKRYRASYYPFGFGPRTCIGNHLATTEIQQAIATLARRFELTRVAPAPAEPEFSTTLRPKGGLWMKIRRRRPAPLSHP